MKILILNGPNLNLQGRRDVAVYGSTAFEEYLTRLRAVFPDVGLDCFQSNVEGELIDALHRSEGRYDGVVFNAGGYTHTSVALRDAVAAIATPVWKSTSRRSWRARSSATCRCWRPSCGGRSWVSVSTPTVWG